MGWRKLGYWPGVWPPCFGGGGLEAYVDGVKIADGAKVGDIDVTGNPLYLGCGAPGWMGMVGVIDEVKIFNKALTEDEINQVMRESGGVVQEAVRPQDKAAAAWGSIKVEYAR